MMNSLPSRYVASGIKISGGMGEITVCNDTILERLVAIKFIKNASHQNRMDDEVAALLKLRSKHVVQIYDVIRRSENEIGIVQEYINGKDLFESYSPATSSTLYYKQIWQIASGLSDIHELGVIHRDIKPNNMKTDPEKVIKIFDFGLARDNGPDAMTQGFVGTRGFAAPELYEQPFAFTNAVDTYAFGATALYLATGSLPTELVAQPPAPSSLGYFQTLPLDIAPEISELLNKSLDKNPINRPTMSTIRDALARYILFENHQALLVHQRRAIKLNTLNRSVRLAFSDIGSIEIEYNGLQFMVKNATGEVHINNSPVIAGEALPGACVVALGNAYRQPRERRFITFDISHPEIVL